jgi:hypothetical protein
MGPSIASTNIPALAAFGWTHVSIPVNPAQANINSVNGIVFHKWINQQWGIASNAVARFWIDNVVFKGNAAPPLPPTVSAPTAKPVPGLNVWSTTEGNGFYDRQEAVLRQDTGLSWVGHASPSHPVSYSFSIVGYPNSQNCEAYMFLAPNPANMDNAPDWNETNCVYIEIQGGPNNATGSFKYKVGETSGQDMYGGGGIYTNAPGTGGGINPESGYLAALTIGAPGVYGTWTVTFTSDTAASLRAPDGSVTNFTFPSYNAPKFAEGNPVGMYLYLGMQANQADGMNQAVVYGNLAVSNTATPFKENFLTDTVLDTTNTWTTAAASGPLGVFIVPEADSGGLWLQWTLPDSGFGLQASSTLNGGSLAWSSPSAGPVLGMAGVVKQLVVPAELPSGNAAFFRLIKRTFTKLQVLLPGETAAPNTLTGKTGTPTPVSLGAGGNENVTVNACDDNWNIISGVTDIIDLTSTDGSAILPLDQGMVNGTITFSGLNAVAFSTEGSQTITATDESNGSITPDTSSPVTVGP